MDAQRLCRLVQAAFRRVQDRDEQRYITTLRRSDATATSWRLGASSGLGCECGGKSMKNSTRGAIGLSVALGLFLAGCSRSPLSLPTDPAERAALCYSAKLSQFEKASGTNALTIDQLNQAAHFLLLGVSQSGIAEPGKLENLVTRGKAHASKLDADGNAAGYAEPCAEAFPQTRTQAFKELPADSPDTRFMCLVLSTALLQMASASKMVPDDRAARYVTFNSRMDQRLTREMQAEAEPADAEFAQRTMRNLAQAVHLGPPTQTMDACIARYSAS